MIKFLLTFGTGLYSGVYLAQNYEIPRVDEPAKYIERLKQLAEEYKKEK